MGISKNIERIEAYDNSHLFGKNAVGAMIVYTKDGFDKKSYRKLAKENHPDKFEEFKQFIKSREDVTTKKRFYMSDYGYSNVREVLLGKTDKLIKNEINFDKFYLKNLVQWWKKIATKRLDKLKKENKLRTELEVWNEQTLNTIDIIR